MLKFLRIAVLLIVLATVAQEAWVSTSRATAWRDPLRVAVYPLNGDRNAATAGYLKGLRPGAFGPVEEFFAEEARRHGLNLDRPISITLAPAIDELPPQPPRNGSVLDNVTWSLKMRWWAWRHDAVPGAKPQIRLFVLYFDPAGHDRLPHSVGIQRGMIGLINVFATQAMAGSNAMIIAHELLHTVGATDKYEPGSNQPHFPEGYAEPERTPRHPQAFAEIMGGRIPTSDTSAEIPASLAQVLIGPATAAEIGWSKP